MPLAKESESITLGGGCFWCLEAVFELVDGVLAVENGYCNGHVEAPSYAQVCTGQTGHNEVVQVSFDAQRISLAELLHIFFVIHDPTSLNRQGNDVGTQYRSGIYYSNEQQALVAREVVQQLQAALRAPVVTELLPRSRYSRAEAYHQHYFARNPNEGYCAFVVRPKVEKFRSTFASRVRA
jgi:peptide-methionine (S)-S-oxide reductase